MLYSILLMNVLMKTLAPILSPGVYHYRRTSDWTLWHWSQVPGPSYSPGFPKSLLLPLSNLYIVTLSIMKIRKKTSKFLLDSNNTYYSPIHQTNHLTVEDSKIAKHYFLFSNPHGLLPITYLSFMCLKMVSRRISFITSCLQIPGSFLCFVKIQVIFLFSVFRNLSQLTFKDNQESPYNDISQHSTRVCNLQTLVTFTLLKCYPQIGEVFLQTLLLLSGAGIPQGWFYS